MSDNNPVYSLITLFFAPGPLARAINGDVTRRTRPSSRNPSVTPWPRLSHDNPVDRVPKWRDSDTFHFSVTDYQWKSRDSVFAKPCPFWHSVFAPNSFPSCQFVLLDLFLIYQRGPTQRGDPARNLTTANMLDIFSWTSRRRTRRSCRRGSLRGLISSIMSESIRRSRWMTTSFWRKLRNRERESRGRRKSNQQLSQTAWLRGIWFPKIPQPVAIFDCSSRSIAN
jgi:hypothetical protein